jgi:DNA-binding NarL/FixJ family response regulator
METAHATPARVFIVEDSASIRERLYEQLREIDGVSVIGNSDTAESAVEAILRTRPDSVILDIHLVEGSGMDVLRQVHARAPEVMFIVLTNHSNEQYRRACLQAGARYFFDKSSEFGKAVRVVAGLSATQH